MVDWRLLTTWNGWYSVLSKERPICFRQAGGTVHILVRKLRILVCVVTQSSILWKWVIMQKAKIFSENNFEHVQIPEWLCTEMPGVCAITHRRDSPGLKNFRTNAPVLYWRQSWGESNKFDSWAWTAKTYCLGHLMFVGSVS